MGGQSEMHNFLSFHLLFHHSLMIHFGFMECIILFISGSVIGIIFMVEMNLLELR
jgi:hypothetical protein